MVMPSVDFRLAGSQAHLRFSFTEPSGLKVILCTTPSPKLPT